MKRCDPNARAKCPDGKKCELYEELADFMNNHNVCDARTNEQCKFNFGADCKECVLDWLREPAEEESNGKE